MLRNEYPQFRKIKQWMNINILLFWEVNTTLHQTDLIEYFQQKIELYFNHFDHNWYVYTILSLGDM